MNIKEYHDRMSNMHIQVIKSKDIEVIKSFGEFLDKLLYIGSPQGYLEIYREEQNKKIMQIK